MYLSPIDCIHFEAIIIFINNRKNDLNPYDTESFLFFCFLSCLSLRKENNNTFILSTRITRTANHMTAMNVTLSCSSLREFRNNWAWCLGALLHDLCPVLLVCQLKKGAFSKKHRHSILVLLACNNLWKLSHKLTVIGHFGHFLPVIWLGQNVELYRLHFLCFHIELQV